MCLFSVCPVNVIKKKNNFKFEPSDMGLRPQQLHAFERSVFVTNTATHKHPTPSNTIVIHDTTQHFFAALVCHHIP